MIEKSPFKGEAIQSLECASGFIINWKKIKEVVYKDAMNIEKIV